MMSSFSKEDFLHLSTLQVSGGQERFRIVLLQIQGL